MIFPKNLSDEDFVRLNSLIRKKKFNYRDFIALKEILKADDKDVLSFMARIDKTTSQELALYFKLYQIPKQIRKRKDEFNVEEALDDLNQYLGLLKFREKLPDILASWDLLDLHLCEYRKVQNKISKLEREYKELEGRKKELEKKIAETLPDGVPGLLKVALNGKSRKIKQKIKALLEKEYA